MSKPNTILIAGPTASGKSALAMALAERAGRAVIINADSMQVYTELRILTARPSPGDERLVRHELFGHVAAREAYSAGRFVEDVRGALERARARRELPVIVGGTGLYFKALLEGLAPIPAIPDEIRRRLRLTAAELGAARLHAMLAAKDPIMAARLVPADTQRITRALEVLEATGKSLADWQMVPGQPLLDEARTIRLVLSPPREALSGRCDDRFDAMLRDGAIDEVAGLAALDLDPGLPAMRALGVRPLLNHLRDECSLEHAAERAKTETRQFAKRQITWHRRHMITWQSHNEQLTERNITEIISLIDY